MRDALSKLGIVFFAAAALSLPICAQVTTACRADIPFDFTMGKATLPAGHYQIQVEPGRSVVTLMGSGGLRRAALSLPEDAYWGGSQQPPSLIFNRYGDQYFLSQVRTADSVRTIPADQAEQELQKHAGARSKVVLAMR